MRLTVESDNLARASAVAEHIEESSGDRPMNEATLTDCFGTSKNREARVSLWDGIM